MWLASMCLAISSRSWIDQLPLICGLDWCFPFTLYKNQGFTSQTTNPNHQFEEADSFFSFLKKERKNRDKNTRNISPPAPTPGRGQTRKQTGGVNCLDTMILEIVPGDSQETKSSTGCPNRSPESDESTVRGLHGNMKS